MIEAQGRPRAQDDVAGPPVAAEVGAQLSGVRRTDFVDEKDELEALRSKAAEKAHHPLFGDHEVADNAWEPVGPAQQNDMIARTDRRQAPFQSSDQFVEALGEHGDQHAEKEHVSCNGDEGRHDAQAYAFIVTEVAGIGKAEEGPPNRVERLRNRCVRLACDQERDQPHEDRHQCDQGRGNREPGGGAAQQHRLDDKLEPVAQRVDDHAWQRKHVHEVRRAEGALLHGWQRIYRTQLTQGQERVRQGWSPNLKRLYALDIRFETIDAPRRSVVYRRKGEGPEAGWHYGWDNPSRRRNKGNMNAS